MKLENLFIEFVSILCKELQFLFLNVSDECTDVFSSKYELGFKELNFSLDGLSVLKYQNKYCD